MANITVPDYDYSGFYYPEILRALLAYLRIETPELNSEESEEPHIQLARAFSLVGHLCNTNVDIIANELLNDSLTLRESMKRLYKLINVKLASATPATVQMAIQLSSVPTTDQPAYIPQYAQFGTQGDENNDQILYEVEEDWPLDRCDNVSHVFSKSILQVGTDGATSVTAPTIFSSSSVTFTSADVGRYLFVATSKNGNHGYEYPITGFVDADNIEIATANFSTETAMVFIIFEYSSDFATEANTSATPFTPWASYDMDNSLYIGHNNVQWSQVDLTTITPSANLIGIWEYYDPTYTFSDPSKLTDNGSYITFECDNLLGPINRTAGSIVKVIYKPTGKYEICLVYYNAGICYFDTAGLLGQSTVDISLLNYEVRMDWVPLNLNATGAYFDAASQTESWDVPYEDSINWQKNTVNGEVAYWCRFRISGKTGTTTLPIVDEINIDQGTIVFPFEVIQGETIPQEVLGVSNGQANQEFTTSLGPVFDNSYTLEIDETDSDFWIEWAAQDSLTLSGSSDRHYTTDMTDDDELKIIFGNGSNGKTPPTDATVRLTYRIGGEENGNVGVNQVTENISSISFVGSMGNPVSGVGWTIKEAGDETDLRRMKRDGPASIRNREIGAKSEDIERLAINNYTYNGSNIIARAFVTEEEYGPKTWGMTLVGTGGNFLTVTQLEDVEEYFNGNKYSIPPVEGKLIYNHEVTTNNYTTSEIDVTVHVIGTGITRTQIVNALTTYLDPLAQDEDGNWKHSPGGYIADEMIVVEIGKISSKIKQINLTLPSGNTSLGVHELPAPGTFTVTVSES